MHRIYRLAGLFILTACFIVPPTTAAQEQKDTKKTEGETTGPKAKGKKDKPKAPDWKVVFDGKITALEDKDDKPLTLTVQITTKVPELNTSVEQQLVQQ